MTDWVDEPEYTLEMPFVVTVGHGGPYDDDAFVAGFDMGRMDSELKLLASLGVSSHMWPVAKRSALAPQIDLLAMRHGGVATFTPWEDGDEYVFVAVTWGSDAPDV